MTIIDEFINAYTQTAAVNKQRYDALAMVLRRMHEAKIEAMLLKGGDLIPRLYGVMGLRGMADVDLLVHETDLPALETILKGMGYRPQIDGNPAYVAPDAALTLDIIPRIWYREDQEGFWRRAVTRQIEGVPVKAMEASDLLLYLIAYSVVHRGHFSSTFARDIALLLGKEHIDWNQVVGQAVHCRLKISLLRGLSFVAKACPGAGIPRDVFGALAPSDLAERCMLWCFERLVTERAVPDLGHLLLWITQPPTKKWLWLRSTLMPPEPFLRYRYGERGTRRPWLTRAGRVAHLMFHGLRLAGRVFSVLLLPQSRRAR